MAKTFTKAEHRIATLFNCGTNFIYRGKNYTVLEEPGKPSCAKGGEPKTDIYFAAEDSQHNKAEFKISYKKNNAEFLENKISSERAEQILGHDWKNIISKEIHKLQDTFLSKSLIYKEKLGNTNKGSITLGWKFEFLNTKSGSLSGDMYLSRLQVIDICAGTTLTGDKKDAMVNGKKTLNSGIANFILIEDENKPFLSAQEVSDSLITIDEYVNEHPKAYFACKALNYRTFSQKYDGDRPLAVLVDWYASNGKLDYELRFDSPLEHGGNYAYSHLSKALTMLNAKTTDDLSTLSIKNQEIVYK